MFAKSLERLFLKASKYWWLPRRVWTDTTFAVWVACRERAFLRGRGWRWGCTSAWCQEKGPYFNRAWGRRGTGIKKRIWLLLRMTSRWHFSTTSNPD